MPKNRALASLVLAVVSFCLWPFALMPALVVAAASLGFAVFAFGTGKKRLVLAGLGVNACGAMTFLCVVPVVQRVREASLRTDIS